ncbi:MAG: cytochrome c3 family protein [Myxococcaceae bacterium]
MKALSLIALCLTSVTAHAAAGRDRSEAIYPLQSMPLSFNHGEHLAAGAECETCHETATKSAKTSDRNLPKHPECETCHEIESAAKGEKTDPPSSCQVCHPSFDQTAQKIPARVELPAANLKFPHGKHVQQKIKCDVCHGAMQNVGLATRMQLPRMDTCLTCHDNSHASGSCDTCHFTAPTGGRLQLKFLSGLLRPQQGDPFGMDHGPRFEFTHGTRAATQRSTCMQCHQESYCQSCHDSLQKPLSVHPNDYISLHPVQARMDFPHCESCHRRQSFCVACHERVGIGPDADVSLKALNTRVHSAAFIQSPTFETASQHHGVEASRNPGACMACHREESCMKCHSTANGAVSGSGTNPHPAGFSLACKNLMSKNDRPCLKCHASSDLAAKGCR